jgi:hypothetical protein
MPSLQIVVFCWAETVYKACLHNLASSSPSTIKMVAACFSETSGSHFQVYTASEGRSPQFYPQKCEASLIQSGVSFKHSNMFVSETTYCLKTVQYRPM